MPEQVPAHITCQEEDCPLAYDEVTLPAEPKEPKEREPRINEKVPQSKEKERRQTSHGEAADSKATDSDVAMDAASSGKEAALDDNAERATLQLGLSHLLTLGRGVCSLWPLTAAKSFSICLLVVFRNAMRMMRCYMS